jgi:hypothetical protein
MRSKIYLGLATLLLVTVVFTAGCGGSTSTPTSSSGTTPPVTTTATKTNATDKTTTTNKTTSATTTVSSGNTLGDILEKTAGIASVKYDMVITAPGSGTITSTIWFKKNKMRTEMSEGGQTTIMLMDMDARIMYSYMPDQNMAIQMTWNPTTKSAADEAKSILDYSPAIIGTETIDGKLCTVVQYTAEGQTAKMWLWQEHGLPIRAEITTPQGTVVMEYKNIQFTDIPDSTFVLPDGVQITKMPGT